MSDRWLAKALADPWYGAAHEAGATVDELLAGGFFDDGLEPGEERRDLADTRLLTTPVDKVRANLWGVAGPAYVLLLTGALSPVHDGHLAALEAARKALEARGHAVVGGYLSPGHDGYVGVKAGGAAARHCELRIAECHAAVQDSDWIDVDPWEARHTGRAVNFTDVLDRLGRYLDARLGAGRVEVAYVCGADNAGFAHAFRGRGTVVVVGRDGWPPPAPGPRVLVARPDRAAGESSTRIRALGRLAPPVPAGRYAVRDDLAEATCGWARPGLGPALAVFLSTLTGALRAAHGGGVVVTVFDPARQRATLRRAAAAGAVLCLDATSGPGPGLALGVSRCFSLSAGQLRPTGVVARPGWPPLAEQAAAVPPGDYVLVDDDVDTGCTVAAVRALLPHARVAQVVTLAEEPESGLLDVLDAKDFLLGTAGGGLVVDGGAARAPYLLPYVSVHARASVPAEESVPFSAALWEANAAFFASLGGPPLTVADADPAVVPVLSEAGFTATDTLADVARWHAHRLRDVPFPGR